MAAELRIDALDTHGGRVNVRHHYTETNTAPASDAAHLPEDIELADVQREFSLKSFKCFAREHPLLLGMGAAGFGAAMATFGAGYVIYRGAQRSLPARMLKMAKFAMTF